MYSKFRRRFARCSRNLQPETIHRFAVAGDILTLQTAMRSAAVFLSNLRLHGSRPTGRAGRLRRSEVDQQRRIGRAQLARSRKAMTSTRGKRVERKTTPRIRPTRKVPTLAFGSAVLH